MTVTLDTDATSLRHDVEALVADHWAPGTTLRRWWAAMADAGLSQPTWPAGLGGRGWRAGDARAVGAALGEARTVAAPTGGVAATLAGPTLLAHGTQEQLVRYLPAIARGEESWCQLFSEPGAGSDLASLTTRADRDGDTWVITGQKVWNSSADVARRGLLLARTDQAAVHRGITMFALDMDQPAITVRPLRQMNGETNFCEVFLDGAVVRADEMIGDLGAGWDVARTTLRFERQAVSNRTPRGLVAMPSGAKAGLLDRPVGELMDEASRRGPSKVSGYAIPAKQLFDIARQWGRDRDPVLRDRLADYYVRTRINRMTVQRIRDAGVQHPGSEGPLVKLAVADTCQRSAALIFDLLGAAGMLEGEDAPLGGALHRSALGSPGARIGGGTDEIQRNVLAERGLGLPRAQPAA